MHTAAAWRRHKGRLFPRWIVGLLLAAVAGCASVPTDYPRTPSSAITDHGDTTLGQHYGALAAEHPGLSGFGLLRYGRSAFSARVMMADAAEKSIDVQVYIWEADETGRIFAERLIRAADRGVRVRLLVDDLGFGGADRALAALDSHPNIEMRVFNPFADRDKTFDFFTDLNRVNHRMHNKMIIADNSFAVVGGRNVGDHYFSVNPDTNFRDLDIVAVGPVVREISDVFDYFWNGDWAVPAAALVEEEGHFADEAREGFVRQVQEEIATGNYPYTVDDDVEEFRRELQRLEGIIVWAPGRLVWDDPTTARESGPGEIITKMRRKFDTLETSLTIESAYFVAGDGGVERAQELIDRGVDIRVFTNSLASNDVLAAHAGHAEYRKPLLEAGVEMYEMRPDSAIIKKTWVGESRAGLHTKAMVFDNNSIFVGSFNLDPRSANINTEAGVYVESEELAEKLLEYMEVGIRPEHAYRVTLDEDGDLRWTTVIDGEEVVYDVDPLSTWGQRFMSGFIELLPVESQL